MRYNVEMIRQRVGGVLQEARIAKDMSQIDLSNVAEVSRHCISFTELNRSMMNLDTLMRICNVLDVNIDTILANAQDENYKPSDVTLQEKRGKFM